jgi:hypothetical protein
MSRFSNHYSPKLSLDFQITHIKFHSYKIKMHHQWVLTMKITPTKLDDVKLKPQWNCWLVERFWKTKSHSENIMRSNWSQPMVRRTHIEEFWRSKSHSCVSLLKWLKINQVFGGFVFWNSHGLVVKWFHNGGQIGKEVVLVQST